MTTSIGGTTGITFNDASVQATAATGFGFKNRVINGAQIIDQRNAGASVTPTTSNTYALDRWTSYIGAASKFSVQQNAGSVTPPVGFTKYLGVTSLAATSLATSDYYAQVQPVEGFNIADFGWGSANAVTVTLSFRVYSSLTGTFGGSLRNGAGDRSYPFTYSIPVANTWTTISIIITGDVTGTWATGNTSGALLCFGLGVGSTYSGTAGAWAAANYLSATGAVSVVGTNGATFYITGVQLEKGSTATSFDYRPYGTELMLCQRYYQLANICGLTGGVNTSTFWTANYYPPVYFRAIPTATAGSATRITNNSVLDYVGVYPISVSPASVNFIQLTATVSSGSNFPTTGVPLTISLPSTINLSMSAEL
jgi:hypothetical protein